MKLENIERHLAWILKLPAGDNYLLHIANFGAVLGPKLLAVAKAAKVFIKYDKDHSMVPYDPKGVVNDIEMALEELERE